MTLNRRDVLKQTGVVAGGAALATKVGFSEVSAAQDGTTLTVWDTITDEQRTAVMEGLDASFTEANAGATVERQGMTLDDLTDKLKQTAGTDEGPTVAQTNNGEFAAGPFVRAGSILNLAEYDAEYGWSERFAPGLLARNRFTPDGKTFGEGDLFGVSAEAEIVGFYYNKTIFADGGFTVPTTVAEFETLLGALREAGQEPLVFGTLDKYQAIHLFGTLQGVYTTLEYLDNLIYRKNDASFDDQSMIDAANLLVKWNDAGYFLSGYEGVGADDAAALFNSGAGAILLSGSWSAPGVKDALGDDAGFFLMPPVEAGGTVISVGGVGIPYSIYSNAPDPDLAAAYLDHLVSEEALNAFIEAGSLPSGTIPAEAIVEGTLTGELYTAFNTALANDTVGHYLDWAADGFYDVVTGALQELLGGQLTAEAFVGKLQEFYAASFS